MTKEEFTTWKRDRLIKLTRRMLAWARYSIRVQCRPIGQQPIGLLHHIALRIRMLQLEMHRTMSTPRPLFPPGTDHRRGTAVIGPDTQPEIINLDRSTAIIPPKTKLHESKGLILLFEHIKNKPVLITYAGSHHREAFRITTLKDDRKKDNNLNSVAIVDEHGFTIWAGQIHKVEFAKEEDLKEKPRDPELNRHCKNCGCITLHSDMGAFYQCTICKQ